MSVDNQPWVFNGVGGNVSTFRELMDGYSAGKGPVLSWMTSLVELSVACAVSAGIPFVQRNSGCQRTVARWKIGWPSATTACCGSSDYLTAHNCIRGASQPVTLLEQLPGEQLSVETTSAARPQIQKHLGNGEPRSFQQTGPGPRIFYRLALNWPGPPEITRPCWQRKSAQGRPLKKEKRCDAHQVRCGFELEMASGHM